MTNPTASVSQSAITDADSICASTPRGSGLRNMRDRVTAMGGTLTVSSGETSGTVITGSVRDTPG